MKVHSCLYSNLGDPCWWPGDNPLEIAIGAVLTQNTSWTNVENTILEMKARDLISVDELIRVSDLELSNRIRSSGYHNQKAVYLKELAYFIGNDLEGRIENLRSLNIDLAREMLLKVKGIGRETADSILCYCAGHPIMVIDAYTRRLMSRYFEGTLGDIAISGNYDQLQQIIMYSLRGDDVLYNRFHALIVLHAKRTCKKEPLCSSCPLKESCSYWKMSRK
jgi:endonuclease-3 related protein